MCVCVCVVCGGVGEDREHDGAKRSVTLTSLSPTPLHSYKDYPETNKEAGEGKDKKEAKETGAVADGNTQDSKKSQ